MLPTNGTNVWIVGQFRTETEAGVVWEFGGVYASREDADAACRDGGYFYAPARVGERLPDAVTEMPGVVYPRADEMPNEVAAAVERIRYAMSCSQPDAAYPRKQEDAAGLLDAEVQE